MHKNTGLKYHRWNMLRRYLNNSYHYDFYALIDAWYYFEFKLYYSGIE